MNGSTHRIRAILEVVSVFLLTFLVIGVVSGSPLDVALICALPYSMVFRLLSLAGSGAGAWRPLLGGALAVGVLSTFAWLLKKKPGLDNHALLVFLPAVAVSFSPRAARAVSALVFYTLFLGPGEEVLLRGYIQSRLNQACGRPESWICAGAWGCRRLAGDCPTAS